MPRAVGLSRTRVNETNPIHVSAKMLCKKFAFLERSRRTLDQGERHGLGTGPAACPTRRASDRAEVNETGARQSGCRGCQAVQGVAPLSDMRSPSGSRASGCSDLFGASVALLGATARTVEALPAGHLFDGIEVQRERHSGE